VTSAEFHAAVVKKHAKKKTAVQQAAAKVVKESYEATVIAKIIEVDFIDEPAEATVEKLREILHQFRLPKYGKRETLIKRLANDYKIELDATEEEDGEPDPPAADEGENGGGCVGK